jgi:hypothetical protein
MTRPIPGMTAPIPSCARLAEVCAALEGREVTCPAALQRSCATLAALRRIARPAGERPRERSAGGATA